jgi:penicillin G amidase
MQRRILWFAAGLAGLVIIATITGGIYLRHQLRASLPQLEGTAAIQGLGAAVYVDRDALGVPTITAASRADAARALGFLHAQDRFFQMDLQRRQAAGELTRLVGIRAANADRTMAVHRFRYIAQEAVKRATPEYRSLLEAYAAGVNAGLNALGARPFEYLMLRKQPEPWKAEDTILTVCAMFNTLQGRQQSFESTFGTIADAVPPAMYEFLTARGSEWDAPVIGERFTRPAIPGPGVFDLRTLPMPVDTAKRRHDVPHDSLLAVTSLSPEEQAGLGSNNWAVDAAHTASGSALVANDMHLAINVPNIWYRASLVFPDGRTPGQNARVTGVTLPGVPSVVVGSNGYVAWGFTNTGGDWSDLILVETDARDPEQYLTPRGPVPFEHVGHDVRWTIWGPVIGRDSRNRLLVQRWVAHDAERLAVDMSGPEQARTVDEALRVAAGLGIPAQNFVAADVNGHIGWTIAGPIPRRVGFDGSRPTSWADGTRRWDGYLSAEDQPRIVDPPSGRIWTANAPVINSAPLAAIGEGGYADGIRARIIRDRLMQIDKATPADMLLVQLDASALFHARWRTLLLEILPPAAQPADPRRADFRRLVETTWTGRADPESVSYLLVRTFRAALARDVFGALTDAIKQQDATFDYGRTLRSEGPLWQLVTEKPVHLLNPKYASWNAQLLAAVDEAIAELTSSGQLLGDRSWATFNRALVAHPLGTGVPLVGRLVNMPSDPLPGDVYTPRAHSPRTGPSERMAVSPGREREGILHMPTGQSGHPLSPHYGDQHRAWVSGEPLPFLPGATVSRLTLTPAR